jgi:AcrR family transcriptional regulator
MSAKSMNATELREHILNTTERLLGSYGYRKMTMEDVAREAGIGKGTTYLYFPSKEELVLSTIDRLVDELIEKLNEIARSDAAVAHRLRLMLVTRVMFRFDRVQNYSEGLNDLFAAIRPNLLKRRLAYFRREAEIFEEVLQEGQNTDELNFEDSAQNVARSLLLATNSLLPFNLSVQELGERNDIENAAQSIAVLMVRGLSHSPDA